VLRTALTLSLATGRPLSIRNIRSGRPKPGLRPQHLTAVRAAVEVGGARVESAEVGSLALRFSPETVRPGRYDFRIGTAGATTLVLQTIVPALALSPSASTVTVSGGTHVPWAPTFEYLARHWAPVMGRVGLHVALVLERAGFYPAGGGRVRAEVAGGWRPKPLVGCRRGDLVGTCGVSLVGNLPTEIAERQARELGAGLRRLDLTEGRADAPVEVTEPPAGGPGTAVYVEAEFASGRGASSALGRRGKPAERVAREAVGELANYLKTSAAFDHHLADQLLLPLALADGESRFTTSAVTGHLLTNAYVIGQFLGSVVQVTGEVGQPGEVRVLPADG